MTDLLRLDTIEAVHPAWSSRVQELCDKTGCWPQSVWRSERLQTCWFECMNNGCKGCSAGLGCHGTLGNCPGANPPGKSFHEYEEDGIPASMAVDLSWSDDTQIWHAHEIAVDEGCDFTIYRLTGLEIWHVQPIETAQYSQAPSYRWTPFEPLSTYLVKPDPWATLFVPILGG